MSIVAYLGCTMILVAEDSYLIAEAIRVPLEDAGYSVVVTGSAADAMRVVEAEMPKAAVIDLQLQDGMSGARLASSLIHRGVPVIVCTGFHEESAYRDSLGFCHAILTKPVAEDDLMRAVAKALANQALAANY